MAEKKRATKRSVTPEVIKYFTDRPGQIVHRSEMAEELNMTEWQIYGAVTRFHETAPQIWKDLETITHPRVWRYSPNSQQNKEVKPDNGKGAIFEQVGVAKDGSVLLQDEEGNFYQAWRL